MRTAIVLETRLLCAPISRDRRYIVSGSMTDQRETILDQAGRDCPRKHSSSNLFVAPEQIAFAKLRYINEERNLPFLTVVYP